MAPLISESGSENSLRHPAPAGKAVVRLRDIGKSYASGVVALRDLTFDVRDGEFLSLLGPSGCGKSPALRILAGPAEASQGGVDWEGGRAPAPGELGFVFIARFQLGKVIQRQASDFTSEVAAASGVKKNLEPTDSPEPANA